MWKSVLREIKGKRASHLPYRGAIIIFVSLILLGIALIAFVFIFNNAYRGRIFPGTRTGPLNLGGQTYQAARQLLQEAVNEIIDQGLSFSYRDETFTIKSTVEDPANPELSSSLFSYNIDKTIARLAATTRERSEAERIYYWLVGWRAQTSFEIDAKKLKEALVNELGQYEQPAVNARLDINDQYAITVASEKGGQAFDYRAIISRVSRNLDLLSSEPIAVALEPDSPTITRAAAESVVGLARQVLEAAPFTLTYQERTWQVTKEQVREWLEFQRVSNQVTVGFNEEKLTNFLRAVAQEIDVETKEAKFTMQDGRVLEFQPSQNGLKLNVVATAAAINENIRQTDSVAVVLIVAETEPTAKTGDINNYGIKELIGEGRSNFRGSPKNRRHNIGVGATTLNGLLIKPGEEFSLVKALGKIEASTGYLPELVIKGNKTIPEYGGGLCQIGTTTFRVVLDAGLPITARTNHSYRVSYYEPAGTDATIYDPKPDFRFINDTGYYILFTTEISGDDLIFRFYGTRDGRKVEQTTPRIFNLVKPGSTKLIETTDLKPGEKKCTERAHTGADTEFTRTVIYSNGEKRVDTFRSHYKPWQEVCLIGVEKLSEPATQ